MNKKSHSVFDVLNIRSIHSRSTSSNPYTYRYSSAFTIVELLVVIVVIGILAAITIVSYSGITSRANIATIQSDLTNASNVLKMDQTVDSNNNFPTTLVGANSGKDITPSQAMDSVIYVPDNTSNPKNFCLEYRKGSITYAVDNTSAPSKGVCLVNLITDSNFSLDSNSDGLADGWSLAGVASKSLNNNIQTYMPNAQYSILQNTAQPTYINDHIYYTTAYVDTDTTSVFLYIYQGSGGSWVGSSHSTTSGFQRLSVKTNIVNNTNSYIYIQDNRTGGFTQIQVKQWITIDLTAAFGTGNEPNQASMDSITNNYPNNWFNIVAKASL